MLVFPTGCAKQPQVQQTTPASTGTSQLTDEHPAEPPAHPGYNESIITTETKINNYLNKNYPGNWNVVGITLSITNLWYIAEIVHFNDVV